MSGADHHLTIEAPYREGDPLEMDDARRASRRMAEIRREAEGHYVELIEDKVQKEKAYRQAVAKTIVALRAQSVGSVDAKERVRGEKGVVDKLVAFRIAEGMVDAQKERLKSLEGERSQLKSLIDYSAKVSVALGEGDVNRQTGEVIGGRRAA